MTILLLGRGKTAAPLGALLHAAKRPFLVASRTIQPNCPFNQATFDWLDEETYENPFLKASIENGLDPITAVWLVPPPVFDMAPPMIAFIDFARRRGVSRFVLLSGSTVEIGGPFMGQVHQYMASLKDIEYSVLRGTWFMQNFSSPEEPHCVSIRNENRIYSAAENGRVPFVSANDVARVAFCALTNQQPHNTDHIILGPELFTYDEVAAIFSTVLGRKISHVKLTESESIEHMKSCGMPEDVATLLTGQDILAKNRVDDRLNNAVEDITGMPPEKFAEFVTREMACWSQI